MKNYFVEYCGRYRIEVKIPTGFFFVEGDVNSGYVIEDSEKNQFLRIPSGFTSDGLYVRGFGFHVLKFQCWTERNLVQLQMNILWLI